MSAVMCSLLAVWTVVCLTHRAPVASQCTGKHCHDADNDVSEPTALLYRLQDTVDQQQDSLKDSLKSLKETMEERHKQLMMRQDEILREIKKLHENTRPTDCADVLKKGHSTSGVYTIRLASKTVRVYCDMTDGGGWLVFQRRVDNTTDFYRDWKSYKEGFGELTGNFWLGNDYLHTITAHKNYTLRINLNDFEGETRYAVYSYFAVANEVNNYTLSLGTYTGGNAGDSLSYHAGRAFSTKDKDNDGLSTTFCAQDRIGAWWYYKCNKSNLNGKYFASGPSQPDSSVNWGAWHGYGYSLKRVVMMLRPH